MLGVHKGIEQTTPDTPLQLIPKRYVREMMRSLLLCLSLILFLGCSATNDADSQNQSPAHTEDKSISQDVPKKQIWQQSRARAGAYKQQADICLYFEDWNAIRTYSTPVTTGKLTTIKMKKVKNLDEFLDSITGDKKLAVVEVSIRFHNHYSSESSSRELKKLEQRIKNHGFRKVVFLSETAVGFVILKE